MYKNRKLNPIEHIMEMLNPYATWSVNMGFCVRGYLSEESLRSSLDFVQKRHPRLNSRIVSSGKDFYFESGVEPIPLEVVTIQNLDEWREIYTQEMDRPLDSSQEVLRVIWVKAEDSPMRTHLLFAFHHAIGDALSYFQVTQQILQHTQQIKHSTAESTSASASPQFFPPVEELLPESLKISNDHSLAKKLAAQEFDALPIEKCVPLENRKNGWVDRIFEEEITQEMVKVCRAKGVRMQGFLEGALATVLAKSVRQEKDQKIKVMGRVYVNLRPYLNPPLSHDALNLSISCIPLFHEVTPQTSIWDIAKETMLQIDTGMQDGTLFDNLIYARQGAEAALENADTPYGTMDISNAGVIPSVDYESLEVERIYFTSTQAAFGVPILYAATYRGKMSLILAFSKPTFSQETMENLMDQLIAEIENACQNSQTEEMNDSTFPGQ